ncbi:putative 2-oxoglutarate-dependent dioxygenase AOP1.2 [Dichanthelium oligosanthes]|uniref:2-oxoglutarate-dependent dioxygenase DAO n=1 Tax=Dichanthelium oligosanthes TaxID=888268 RepID=A0A1E5VDZ3_9POAL|nr:putative 2-oxoglutarate-dependent dioxygenase AOP1.2 [Dichanthelium oligosanthes]
MASKGTGRISKVDLRGVEPGGPGWEEAKAAVTASMEALGAVLVVHDAVDPDLHQALFGRAAPEFFALPLDVKQRLVKGPIDGYLARSPRAPVCESVRIWEATHGGGPAAGRNWGDVVWPRGNPSFRDTVSTFAKNMMALERTVSTMILESLGVRDEERLGSHLDTLAYNVRLAHYRPPADAITGAVGNDMLMQAHRDLSTLSIVVQHDVEGLEVQLGDGSWVAVPPEPGTVAVFAGEMLTVVTNGRVPAGVHRVRTPSNRERLSALFFSQPKGGSTVRPLEELVGEDHPRRYNPCNLDEYIEFRFTGDGRKFSDPLKGFCGV